MKEYRYRIRFSLLPDFEVVDGFKSRDALKKVFLEKLPLSINTGKAKFSFGPTIAREHLSECEFVDVWLKARPKKEDFASFFDSLPKGISFIKAYSIPVFFPAIEAMDLIEEYTLYPKNDISNLKNIFDKNIRLSTFEITIEKNGNKRKEDLFIWLHEAIWQNGREISVFMKRIKGRTIRPELAVQALAGSHVDFDKVVKKNMFWMDSSGNLNEI